MVGELLVFYAVTAIVHRPRPPVVRLDVAPPTSSFPSGHTAAAFALYGCIAILVLWIYGRRPATRVAVVVLFCLPFVVGRSRLYRGMHYPSDVLAGALTGGLWLLLVITTSSTAGHQSSAAGHEETQSRQSGRPLGESRCKRQEQEANVAGPPGASAGESAVAADLPLIMPVPMVLSRVAAAKISVAAGLTFAVLTIWIARRGSAVPGVDEHAHRWTSMPIAGCFRTAPRAASPSPGLSRGEESPG